jgi:hypothetical protein
MKRLVLLLCLLAPMTLLAQAPAPALSLVTDPCAVANHTIYCTYAWNASTACCNPVRISPGASCPQLCR